MLKNLKLVLGAGVLTGALVFSSVTMVHAAAGCSPSEVAGAKLLAKKVKALSLTDPAGALAIAQNVASTASQCFQVAFGAELDGTGTASTGGGAASPG
jgi:hypothetical protein